MLAPGDAARRPLNVFLSLGATFGPSHPLSRTRSAVAPDRCAMSRSAAGIFTTSCRASSLAQLSGGLSIVLRREQLDHWLAVSFRAGAALIVDETALLIKQFDDVYWSDKACSASTWGWGATSAPASLALLVRLSAAAKRWYCLT
jgi:hypothetical protein